MELMSIDAMVANGTLIDTGDVCSLHSQPYYIRRTVGDSFTQTAFCLACAESDVVRREAELTNKSMTTNILLRTYHVFEDLSIIPKDLKDATIKNYKVETEQDQKALAFAKRATRFYGKDGVGNTVFQGPAGVGKSHLSIAIARSLNDTHRIYNQPKSVVFMPVARLIQKVQNSFDNGGRFNAEFATKLLTECDYLVLDDLGKETSTGGRIKPVNEWTYRFLFNILDSRDKTIINTNFTWQELARMYDQAFVDRLTKGTKNDPDRIFKFKDDTPSKR